jgi:hypothetical protein
VLRALVGEAPLQSEIPFHARLGAQRDNRQKQRAVADLLANSLVPRIATAQFTLVEPNFDARGPKRFADTASQLRVLRGIADEDGLSSAVQRRVAVAMLIIPKLFACMVANALQLSNDHHFGVEWQLPSSHFRSVNDRYWPVFCRTICTTEKPAKASVSVDCRVPCISDINVRYSNAKIYRVDEKRGKGSHVTLYLGGHMTIVRNPKDELKTGTLHAMCKQLGIKKGEL